MTAITGDCNLYSLYIIPFHSIWKYIFTTFKEKITQLEFSFQISNAVKMSVLYYGLFTFLCLHYPVHFKGNLLMVTLHHPTDWNGIGQLPSLSLLYEPQISQMHYKIIFNSFIFSHSFLHHVGETVTWKTMHCRFVLVYIMATCMSFYTIYAFATLRKLHSLD